MSPTGRPLPGLIVLAFATAGCRRHGMPPVPRRGSRFRRARGDQEKRRREQASHRRARPAASAGERRVTDLAAPLDVSLPAVSQHLGVLLPAGLVSEQRFGRERRSHLIVNGARFGAPCPRRRPSNARTILMMDRPTLVHARPILVNA